jgi:hypothetical protein
MMDGAMGGMMAGMWVWALAAPRRRIAGDRDRQGSPSLIVTAARLTAIALPLNLAWELLQAPAYGPMGDTWVDGLLVCVRAALGDVAIFLVLFGVGRLLFGRDWFAPPRIGRYATVLGVAVAIQVAVEWAALATGRWGYAAWHPTILGAGLLPILQAVVLVPLTFGVLARWHSWANAQA